MVSLKLLKKPTEGIEKQELNQGHETLQGFFK